MPMFNYPEFLRDLVVDSKFDHYVRSTVGYQEQLKKDILFSELARLLCRRSIKLRSLSISPCNMLSHFVTLLTRNDNLSQIKKFTFDGDFIYTTPLYKDCELIYALSQVSQDITHVRITNIYKRSLGDSLVTLLNSQKNLRLLDLNCPVIQNVKYFESIFSKLKSPQSIFSLSFENIDFSCSAKRSINTLEKSRNLKKLKMIECVNCTLLYEVMRSWENLVEFTYHAHKFNDNLEFLLTMMRLSSNSLRYLDIFWIREDGNFLKEKSRIINCITQYCAQLTSLKLRSLHCEDLFTLWHSCKQLEAFSFICCEDSGWNDCLEELGKYLPHSIKILKIGNWNGLPFNSVALGCFLRGCKNSLNKLELCSIRKLSENSEYINVLNSSGVHYEFLNVV
ncbi:6642_t:CDS:1 [Funneliformis geosporum]|uniref:6642_t:CDS:1 n=1 Tax=Funneliformis geosporum TaxID=1117311 RepID=A0A9W4SR30_9GLOM|nr:6642_t:CDS:1 [Funneliformis geosporum]